MTRDECVELDRRDPLAPHRRAFQLPENVIYLDGNSLGALPRATPARLREVIEREWGDQLIRAWNDARWIDLPQRVAAKIARLVGARSQQLICADSTSVNLFKVLAAALRLQESRPQVSVSARRVIVSERDNFPTDLYVAQGVADWLAGGHELRLVESGELADAIDERTAVLLATHVDFRTGAMHDMRRLTRRCHDVGALAIWDLAHSAGAVPLALDDDAVDFAVGCGYKYLNGGPGAPAFVYVAEHHLAAMADQAFAQPLAGWFGHRDPFAFDPHYQPAASIDRFAVGTPSILALAALEIGVDTVLAAGVAALREKSVALSELFIAEVERRCTPLGVTLASPRDARHRGSQVSLRHAEAYAVVQAMIDRGVIGDFRSPDIMRFGFAPLYVTHVDAFDAAQALAEVLAARTWDRPAFRQRAAVT